MRAALTLAATLACACGHGEPWAFTAASQSGPLAAGAVTRLTYNAGDDLTPSWFPDGNSFIYATARLDRPDHDRCLAVMPAVGGTVSDLVCQRSGPSDDSLDVMQVPTPGPDGRVAFLYSTFDRFPFTSYVTRQLMVGRLDSALVRSARKAIYPLLANGGYPHDGIGGIAWRSPTELVYLATLPHYPQPCKTCRPDTATPVQLVTADISGDTAIVTAIPNTIYATSFALPSPDTLYYTLLGDGRILRRDLRTGTDSLVRDYGSATIVRDVQVVGSRLLAIVGGNVTIELLIGIGWVQHDDGGEVHLLALDSGAETVVDTWPRLFRRAALSPDGHTMLAESRDAPAEDWDIWRVSLP